MDVVNKSNNFVNLLQELFFRDQEIPNQNIKMNTGNIRVNRDIIFEIGNIDWKLLLITSHDFEKIQAEYSEEFESWIELYNAFQEAQRDGKILKFIENKLSGRNLIRYKEKKLSIEEITEIINWKKPKFSNYYEESNADYINLLIFENDLLHINLHLKLNTFENESFVIISLISIWLKNSLEIDSLNIKSITNNFQNYIFAYEVLKNLENQGFYQVDLPYDWDYFDPEDPYNKVFLNKWALDEPDLFLAVGKGLLNANPTTLFSDIFTDYDKIIKFIAGQISKNIISPKVWLNELNLELRQLFEKEEFILTKIREFTNFSEVEQENKPKPKIKRKKEKEKNMLEEIILLLKNIRDMDETGGFISINKLYEEYIDKNLMSKQTFYNFFNNNWEKLKLYVEKRNKKGKGGAELYRYKKQKYIVHTEDIRTSEYSPKEIQIYLEEKMKIHKATLSYNSKNYKQTIELLEELLKEHSDYLKKDNERYLGILYYLGKSYFNLNNFDKALQYFNQILEIDDRKYEVYIKILESYRYLREYSTGLTFVKNHFHQINEIWEIYGSSPIRQKILPNPDQFIGINFFSDFNNIHQNLLNRDILTKYIILFNKKIDLKKYNVLPPKDMYDDINRSELIEEHYQKLEFLNKNLFALEKISKIYIYFLYYKLEMSRRLIFRYVINNEMNKFHNSIKDLLEFMNTLKPNYIINYNHFHDYLVFIANASKFHSEESYQITIKEIQSRFPDFSPKLKGPSFSYSKYFEGIIRYLFQINLVFQSNYMEDWYKNISFYIFEHELKAGFYLIQIYTTNRIILIEDYKNLSESLKTLETLKIEGPYPLVTKWGYQIYGYDQLKTKINKLTKIANKYNLEAYRKWSDEFSNNIEINYRKLKELRKRGRSIVINNAFKNFYNEYKPDQRSIKLDYTDNTETEFYALDQIIEEILGEINKEKYREYYKIKIFEIKSSNKYIIKQLDYIFKKNYPPPNEIEVFSDNNTVILTQIPTENFHNSATFLRTFFTAIQKGAESIILEYDPSEYDKVKSFFEGDFQEDFENDFFNIYYSEYPNLNRIHIKIQKKIKL